MSSWTDNLYSTWTDSARYCYERGCVCSGCLVKEIIESECRMKRAVFELVRKYGAPPSNESTLTKTEQKIVDAINAGADTLNEIQEETGLSRESVLTGLSKMYELAEYDGVRYKNKRNKFVEFIKWVRGEQL